MNSSIFIWDVNTYINKNLCIYVYIYIYIYIYTYYIDITHTHTHTHTHGFTHNMTVFDMTYMTYMYIHMTMYDMAVCHIHYPCICIDRRIKDMTTPPSSVPAGCGVPIQS